MQKLRGSGLAYQPRRGGDVAVSYRRVERLRSVAGVLGGDWRAIVNVVGGPVIDAVVSPAANVHTMPVIW